MIDGNTTYTMQVEDTKAGYLAKEIGTVLTGLVNSYSAFQFKFTQYSNNYESVPVLYNSSFGYGRNQSIKIDATFFGEDLMWTHYQAISSLTWKDCTINGTMVNIHHFNAHTRIPLNREQYYDLKTAQGKNFFKDGAESMSIADFLQGFKKGSRKFQKILGYDAKEYDITKLTQVNTMTHITNTAVPGVEWVTGMYSMWGKIYLNNDIRVFLLKYYNNILGLGNRIAHFVQNAESRCSFCLLASRPDLVPESFEHIFYASPTIQTILKKFLETFMTKMLTAEFYFTGSG
jgi:hypothetical protein